MQWFTPELLRSTLDMIPTARKPVEEEKVEFQPLYLPPCVCGHYSEANWVDLLGPALPYNIFTTLPVEIIREIVDIPGYPEVVAALSLCNKDVECILEGFCDPVNTAYVALCSLEIALVRCMLRKSGGRAMRDGLTKYMNDIYALNPIVQHDRRDISE